MGNQLAAPPRLQPEILSELPNVVLKDSLGGSRFMKTLLCVHDDGGLVVVKVYHKRSDTPDLRQYEQKLADIRARLAQSPHTCHVWPFQTFLESERAAYLVRQYVFSNLYHRLSTRPFLSTVEKLWVAYQLLLGVQQAHAAGVVHGDIKCENCLVTSWGWAYVTDFAPFKPACLPADNPAAFSFFFDTGGRRRCYVAPERFYTERQPQQQDATDVQQQQPLLQHGTLTPPVDIFSLGCVLAELFLEGTALFDLSKLLAYRRGEYDPSPVLQQLAAPIRELILHMIQRDPGARLSAEEYLGQWGPRIFPAYFESVSHPFFRSILHLDADGRVAATKEAFEHLLLRPAPDEAFGSQRVEAGRDYGVGPPNGSSAQQGSVQGGGSSRLLGVPSDDTLQGGGSSRFGLADGESAGGAGGGRGGGGGLLDDVDALLSDTRRFMAGLQVDASSDEAAGLMMDGASAGGSCMFDLQASNMMLPQPPPSSHHPPSYSSGGGGGGQPPPSTSRPSTHPPVAPHDDDSVPRRGGAPPTQGAALAGSSSGGIAGAGAGAGGGQGMTLVAVLLCTLLRGARLQENRIQSAMMLAAAAAWCDDDTLLQRIVPYILSLVGDHSAAVRWVALRCLARVLRTVRCLPPSETRIFSEYVLPSLSLVPNDSEEAVRAEYAAILGHLAEVAQRFLSTGTPAAAAAAAATAASAGGGEQGGGGGGGATAGAAVAAHGREAAAGVGGAAQVISGSSTQQPGRATTTTASAPPPLAAPAPAPAGALLLPEALDAVRWAMERAVHELVVGTRSSAATRQAILTQVQGLAEFLGKTECNNFLLPALITFLNDTDWRLRAAFYDSIGRVASYAGPAALEVVLLPCLERAADCPEAPVVAAATRCLTQMAGGGMLRKPALLRAASHLLPRVLLHVSPAVRAAGVRLAGALANALSPVDRYARLLPMLLPALVGEPVGQLSDEAALARSMLPPPVLLLPEAQAAAALVPPQLGQQQQQGLHDEAAGGPRQRPGSSAAYSEPDGAPDWVERHLQVQVPAHGQGGFAGGGASASAPPAAVYYSVPVQGVRQQGAASGRGSLLSAALDTVAASKNASGHLIAFHPDTPSGQRTASVAASASMMSGGAQEVGQQLAAAASRIVPHAGGGAGDLPGSPSLLAGGGGASLLPGFFGGGSSMDASRGGNGGGAVSDAMAAALATGMPTSPAPASFDISPWRPAGVLVAHLAEHRLGVNQLAAQGGGAFFVSASDDHTVKVWDTRRLERDVTFRSRLTYSRHPGRVLSACVCEDGQSVASGCSGGQLHVWRVEVTCRAGGAPDRYKGVVARVEADVQQGAVMAVQQGAGGLLLYATQRGGVRALDPRMGRDVWALDQPPSQGMVRCLAADPLGGNWLVAGSSRGVMGLWDVRFQLPVHSWQLPGKMPINALAPALAAPARLGLAGPVVQRGPMVYSASNANEVSLWDVEQGRCHQVLRVIPPHEPEAARQELPIALRQAPCPGASAGGNASAAGSGGTAAGVGLGPELLDQHLALQELHVPQARIAGCRALLATGAGPLLAAGSDRCIRLWDSLQPNSSYLVCGPAATAADGLASQDATAGAACGTPCYSVRNIGAVRVVEETCSFGGPEDSPLHQQGPAFSEVPGPSICHQDAISHLAYVDATDRLLLSASRDGVIKAWR